MYEVVPGGFRESNQLVMRLTWDGSVMLRVDARIGMVGPQGDAARSADVDLGYASWNPLAAAAASKDENQGTPGEKQTLHAAMYTTPSRRT